MNLLKSIFEPLNLLFSWKNTPQIVKGESTILNQSV